MDRDSRRMRGARPFIFTNLKKDLGVLEIANFIIRSADYPIAAADRRAAEAGRQGEHPASPAHRQERRQYNQWVNSQTLEDYALRYTPERARKSSFRVGNTALGPIAFLACEAIGGALTLTYGFANASGQSRSSRC